MTRAGAERGVAITMAVMACLLISAIGAVLLLLSSSEGIIAAQFRGSVEVEYAAEAMMARAIDLVAGLEDWAGPIAGSTRSALVDGTPSGLRLLRDGSTLDLDQAVNLANCQKTTACSASDLAAVTADRPWGVNNPVWRLYAYGPLGDVFADANALDPGYYVMVLVADDPTGSHRVRADGQAAPTREGIALRADAFGPRGTHAVIEVFASRDLTDTPNNEKDYNPGTGPLSMKILSWCEVR